MRNNEKQKPVEGKSIFSTINELVTVRTLKPFFFFFYDYRIKSSQITQTRGFDNGPFATNDHMVQNPPYWRAGSLLFSHWDIKTKASQA